jgi:acyl-CoA thioesterase-2
VFGGQVAAQALVAAGRTVDQGLVHSLHAYFLRPGDPAIPIIFDVDRIRDGRSFTTRRVVGDPARPGDLQPVGVVPRPETGPSTSTDARRARSRDAADHARAPRAVRRPVPAPFVEWIRRERPIDTRSPSCRAGSIPCPSDREPEQLVWFRANGTLPDDPCCTRASWRTRPT